VLTKGVALLTIGGAFSVANHDTSWNEARQNRIDVGSIVDSKACEVNSGSNSGGGNSCPWAVATWAIVTVVGGGWEVIYVTWPP
jgi:hypothetical protein